MPVCLITGCSSGFGLAAAQSFARRGYRVIATMRDPDRGRRLASMTTAEGWNVAIRQLDVTRSDTFPGLIEEIIATDQRIDVLVNNAGITHVGALEDVSEATLRRVFETNAIGPLLLARAVLPHMRAQGGGKIIMVSSLSGVAGLPGDVPYAASKFALEGATEALRHEVDRWNIHVALVEAGLYATGIFDRAFTQDSPLPSEYPDDSPYRPLIEARMSETRARMPDAFDPNLVADLLVQIAESDGSRLRWPADAVATRVLETLLAQNDHDRDAFLREVAGTDWWSRGEDPPA